MAVNTERSMNGDRKLGENDGMMKSIAPSRGGILEEEHALERAKLLEQDGLVEILENRLVVTHLGKRFLRNICMSLDARLWSEQPETQLFSMAG